MEKIVTSTLKSEVVKLARVERTILDLNVEVKDTVFPGLNSVVDP